MIIIKNIRYEPSARYFVSSSRDGSIKLWDAVSNKCVNTFEKAHDGNQVCSVTFSRNGKVKFFNYFFLTI